MSQSLTITGIYRNGQQLTIGLHNPNNNRVATSQEFAHLRKMYKQYFKPLKHKFIAIKVHTHTMNGGCPIYGQSHTTLLDAYRTILNDIPDF